MAETVQAPIFHVNADAPELVDQIFKLAFEYRQKFKKDVVIDVIGYRKHGHNELDQPSFTQPMMYKIIDSIPPVYDQYKATMLSKGIWTEEQVKEMEAIHKNFFVSELKNSRDRKFEKRTLRLQYFEELKPHKSTTGLPIETIKELNEKVNHITKDKVLLDVHSNVQKVYDFRYSAFKDNIGFDFGAAEGLAWASLLKEGFGVRVTGQDVERGTFSHRHSKIIDQSLDRQKYVPLENLLSKEDLQKQKLLLANSHLSEYGVLGFEYGYSLINNNFFVGWEAQFGDFANGAQIMIDNYIVSGESKWGVQSGIAILLPHGMDGQGSEHSSGRLERFLSLSNDDEGIFSKPDKLAE